MMGRMPMRAQPSKTSPVLQAFQQEVARQRTNPYRLAKLTGLRVSTMQRFLAGESSPTLATLEAVASALGLVLTVKPGAKSTSSDARARR
jgi:DNA-binding phage protein